jgi:hypothetical protein
VLPDRRSLALNPAAAVAAPAKLAQFSPLASVSSCPELNIRRAEDWVGSSRILP